MSAEFADSSPSAVHSEYRVAIRYLTLAFILWGVGTAFRAPVLRSHESGPLALSFLAAVAGMITMLFVMRNQMGTVWRWYKQRPLFYLVLGPLQNGAAVFTFVAMQELSLTTTSMLGQTQPLFTQLFALLLLREWVAKRILPYAVVAILGAMLVVVPDPTQFKLDAGDGLALGMLVISIALAALWVVCVKIARTPAPGEEGPIPGEVLAMISFIGATLFFSVVYPIALFWFPNESPLLLSNRGWAVGILTGGVSSVVALLWFFRGQGHGVSASLTGLLQLLNPLTCVIAGLLFLGDVVTWTQLVGMVLLIFSMRRISTSRKIT